MSLTTLLFGPGKLNITQTYVARKYINVYFKFTNKI